MKIALAQVAFEIGNFEENSKKVLKIIEKTKGKASLLLFPEGGLSGYPIKDLIFYDDFLNKQQKALEKIHKKIPESLRVLLPGFSKQNKSYQNVIFDLSKNKKPQVFAKTFLPDNSVFFESRYFKKGDLKKNIISLEGKSIQLLICRDMWHYKGEGEEDLVICLSASPWTDEKEKTREKLARSLVKNKGVPLIYLNKVGAQDCLIFDGGSFVLNEKNEFCYQAPLFEEDLAFLDLKSLKKKTSPSLSLQKKKEKALVLGIKSFFKDQGFKKAILGLSGGLDSALTAFLAVKALGEKNVQAFFLPSIYTEKLSFEIVKDLKKSLGLNVVEKNIDPLIKNLSEFLNLDKKRESLSFQNLQARIRMLLLMFEANKNNALLLCTSNKSELATGYTTLYGDMAGALAPIADLFKTEVFDLAKHINKEKAYFSKKLLTRSPSAELKKNQKDEEDLMPYEKLDSLLKDLLNFQSISDKDLMKKVQAQEFKRHQAPLLLKLSETDLGESWRMPIVKNFSVKGDTV